MHSFMDLHIKLQTHALPLPIIPLTPSPSSDPAALPTTLRAFHSSLLAAVRGASRYWPVDAARELLPWCTTRTVTVAAGAAAVGYGEGWGEGHGRWQGGGYGYGHGQGQGQGLPRGVDSMFGALSEGAVERLMARWFSFGELLEGISTGEVVGGAGGDGVVSFWQFEFATG
ncbi:hypothetical protein B0I37DRAFT_14250 [Chaetomium sp. MPI-CAGE-AT-0009]|nr:hypothetical protein B0I37DRAFT_14250 [Chaetomium sp. MPI-CAGE-AT-0009]